MLPIFLFSTIFCDLILDFCVKTRSRFSLRDKRLFEIIEVEITRVDCICPKVEGVMGKNVDSDLSASFFPIKENPVESTLDASSTGISLNLHMSRTLFT